MKTKTLKMQTGLETFLKKEIKHPEAIQGGTKGPIGRDKIRTPRNG